MIESGRKAVRDLKDFPSPLLFVLSLLRTAWKDILCGNQRRNITEIKMNVCKVKQNTQTLEWKRKNLWTNPLIH